MIDLWALFLKYCIKEDCFIRADEHYVHRLLIKLRNLSLRLPHRNDAKIAKFCTTKCANEIQCISKLMICDGLNDCRDKSDEMCKDSCLKEPLNYKSIVRKCPEENTVCVPVERYCNRVADCPDGSDETDCSCEDWNMHQSRLEGINMCIYKQWFQNNSMDSMCDQLSCDVAKGQQWQSLLFQGLLINFVFFLFFWSEINLTIAEWKNLH